MFFPCITGAPSIAMLTRLFNGTSNFSSIVSNAFFTSNPRVVSFRATKSNNSSFIVKSGVTNRIKTASWGISLISVDSSRAKLNEMHFVISLFTFAWMDRLISVIRISVVCREMGICVTDFNNDALLKESTKKSFSSHSLLNVLFSSSYFLFLALLADVILKR